MLFLTEQVTRATDFKVSHRKLVAAAEVGKLLQRLEAAHRFLRDFATLRNDEERFCKHAAAAHATAHLVKLADAKVMRVHDDNRIRVRHVQARFDDARAHENVELARKESVHHAFEFVVFHLPMRHRDLRFGRHRLNLFGKLRNRLHAVIHDKHLAATSKFVKNRVLQNFVIALHQLCFDRQTVDRRRIDERNIANASHAQVQRTRDRRSTHAERIHGKPELAQFFLLLHAELLLFVDNQKSQVLELALVRQQRMRPDDDVHRTVRNLLEDFLLFFGALVAVHERNLDRVSGKAFAEVFVMLRRKNRSRHEDGDLLIRGHALERRTHRDFRLAKAHVTANEAVHRATAFHIALDVGRSTELVWRRIVFERFLEFLLHVAVGRESETFDEFALGVKFHKVARNLDDLFLDALLDVFPSLAAETVELRFDIVRTVEAFNLLQVRHGELQAVAAIVFQQRAVDHTAVDFDADKSQIATNAVVFVRHKVTAIERFNHQRIRDRPRNLVLTSLVRMTVQNSRLSQERNIIVFEPEPFRQVSDKIIFDRQAVKNFTQAVHAARRLGHHVNATALVIKFFNFFCDRIRSVRRKVLRTHMHLVPVAVIDLHASHVKRSPSHKQARKFANLEPKFVRRSHSRIRHTGFVISAAECAVHLRRRFRKQRKFLEDKRCTRHVIQEACHQTLVMWTMPPQRFRGTFLTRHHRFRHRKFTHREELDMRHLLQRTLRENIECTDRFNLVAVKFNTNRMRVQKAVHIDNAPANRKLTYAAHHRLFRKTVIEEPRAQRRRLQLIADAERTHLTHDFARFREFHQKSIERTNDNKRLFGMRNIAEKLQTFFKDPLERHLDFIRFQAERREKANKLLAHHTFEILDPNFGTAVILRNHQNVLRAFQEAVRHHHRS